MRVVATALVALLASCAPSSATTTSGGGGETPTTAAPTSTAVVSSTMIPTTVTEPPSTATTGATPETTAAPVVTTSAAAPMTTQPGNQQSGFESEILAVTADDLAVSWHTGCPVGPADLRAIRVSHWDMSGTARTGTLIVGSAYAGDLVAVFSDLFEAGFPIERMEPVDRYGADDDASMAANNTSAFNCRVVAGTSTWSEHAYGRAIDLNPLINPYVLANGSVFPPEGADYVDRDADVPGLIVAGDMVVQSFARIGWSWGGNWSGSKDYQHFSATGR